jgi:hypothetical protein
MKRVSLALALCCSLFCSAASAKTFVAVLWPMFGPLPAIGLVELVGELKFMPDVEVHTYLHQEWPSLVEDIDRLPAGTRTVVVGYSLGANSTVFVANKSKYIDAIIALQPSMLSWNPNVTGRVGRMIEVYNPNPWMTFGGMGSKKLIGPNIEYIANNDSHPGAQFNSEFRSLVKSEISRVSTEPVLVTAYAPIPSAPKPTNAVMTAQAQVRVQAQVQVQVQSPPKPANASSPTKLAAVKPQPAKQHRLADATAFLDSLTNTVDSGNLFTERQLTIADLTNYANRNYGTSRTAEAVTTTSQYR